MSQQLQPYMKYTKIVQPAPASNPDQHEIRVTTNKAPKTYIERALFLFRKKKLEHVVLKASGAAISTLCISAEIIRNTLKNLHQLNKITNTTIVDVYEPNEEGLDTVTVQRKMAILEVKLMMNTEENETTEPGYQPPLDPQFNPEKRERRGGYNNNNSNRQPRGEQQQRDNYHQQQRYNRFRPRYGRRAMGQFRGQFRRRGGGANFHSRGGDWQPNIRGQQHQGGAFRPRRMMYTKFQGDEQYEQEKEQGVVHRGAPVMRRPAFRRGFKY